MLRGSGARFPRRSLVQHWNGASWTAYDGGTTATLHGVWGAPNGDVWVAASDNQVLRLRAAQ